MFTGRCYCGACAITLRELPLTTAYCHCGDCKRWTGAPLPAFAAVKADAITVAPDPGEGKSFAEGVRRWTCPDCGSPLMATFDYLPGQVYIPLGVLDQADQFAPSIHCHHDAKLSWLHLEDDLPREGASGRAALSQSSAT